MSWFRRSWTQRMLRNVTARIEAPLEMIPPGFLSPGMVNVVVGNELMMRLLKLHNYLAARALRKPLAADGPGG